MNDLLIGLAVAAGGAAIFAALAALAASLTSYFKSKTAAEYLKKVQD